jgi:hypothetical protein
MWLSPFWNEGISAASFWRQVAALVPGIFCNFYLVKNHTIANNSATAKAREKITTHWEPIYFYDGCLTKFKNIKFYLKLVTDF